MGYPVLDEPCYRVEVLDSRPQLPWGLVYECPLARPVVICVVAQLMLSGDAALIYVLLCRMGLDLSFSEVPVSVGDLIPEVPKFHP